MVVSFIQQLLLFPAQAGVILDEGIFDGGGDSVPRASGGDPKSKQDSLIVSNCSPRKRG